MESFAMSSDDKTIENESAKNEFPYKITIPVRSVKQGKEILQEWFGASIWSEVSGYHINYPTRAIIEKVKTDAES
jgi:hypothetical protein